MVPEGPVFHLRSFAKYAAADLKKIPLRSEQFILPSELHELLGLERSPGCPTGSRMALFLVPA